MKTIYSDMFYDMRENNCTEEEVATAHSKFINDDLDAVKAAIQDLEPKKAIEKINKMKEEY